MRLECLGHRDHGMHGNKLRTEREIEDMVLESMGNHLSRRMVRDNLYRFTLNQTEKQVGEWKTKDGWTDYMDPRLKLGKDC